MSKQTQTALDALFGVPATVTEPPPVPVEVVQPVPVIVIAQPVRRVPVRAVPAAPMCLASRRTLTGRRPVSGYPYWTTAEREQEQRKITQHLEWCSAHLDPWDNLYE